jgi:hypothetical protein
MLISKINAEKLMKLKEEQSKIIISHSKNLEAKKYRVKTIFYFKNFKKNEKKDIHFVLFLEPHLKDS